MYGAGGESLGRGQGAVLIVNGAGRGRAGSGCRAAERRRAAANAGGHDRELVAAVTPDDADFLRRCDDPVHSGFGGQDRQPRDLVGDGVRAGRFRRSSADPCS